MKNVVRVSPEAGAMKAGQKGQLAQSHIPLSAGNESAMLAIVPDKKEHRDHQPVAYDKDDIGPEGQRTQRVSQREKIEDDVDAKDADAARKRARVDGSALDRQSLFGQRLGNPIGDQSCFHDICPTGMLRIYR